jgi:diguanylate cyclase (GGDEF)-like protein
MRIAHGLLPHRRPRKGIIVKLLIADDDRTTRSILNVLTAKWGYQPVLAEDGEQAIAMMQAQDPPRLLLLDWEMPGIDGLTVCRRLRNIETQDPPFIILLTVRHDSHDVVAGLDAGANDYVAKPFDREELRARLKVGRRMLDLQSQLQTTQHKLNLSSTHDTLTGLLNRDTLLAELKRELARARREHTHLCLGLCDIDEFRRINDGYGHLAGDAVLRALAMHLRQTLRPYDRIARYGGEEFLIMTSGLPEDCHKMLERVRISIESTRFEFQNLAMPLALSIGGVCFRPDIDGYDIKELLGLAGEALAQAKAQGANQTVVKHASEPQ